MEKKTSILEQAVNLLSPTMQVEDGWLQEEKARQSKKKATPPLLPGGLEDPHTLNNDWFNTPRATPTVSITGDQELDSWYKGVRKAPPAPVTTKDIDDNWEWVKEDDLLDPPASSASVHTKSEPRIEPTRIVALVDVQSATPGAAKPAEAKQEAALPELTEADFINEITLPPVPKRAQKTAPAEHQKEPAAASQSRDLYIIPAGNTFAEPRFIHRHMTRKELMGKIVVDGEGQTIGTVKEVVIKEEGNRGIIRLSGGGTILLHHQDLAPKNKAREEKFLKKQAERKAAAAERHAAILSQTLSQKKPEDEASFSLASLTAPGSARSPASTPAPKAEDTQDVIDLNAIAAQQKAAEKAAKAAEEAARIEKALPLFRAAGKTYLQNHEIAGSNAKWFRNDAGEQLYAMFAPVKPHFEMKPVPAAAKPAKKLSARGLRNIVATLRAKTAAHREDITPFEKKGLLYTIKGYWEKDDRVSAFENWARRASAVLLMVTAPIALWAVANSMQEKAHTQPEGKSADTSAEFAAIPPVPTVRTWDVDRAPGLADEVSLHSVIKGQKDGSIRDVYNSIVEIGEASVMTEAQRLAAERRHMKQVLDNTAKEIDAMASSPASVNVQDLKKPLPQFNVAAEPVAGDSFMPKNVHKKGLRAVGFPHIELASQQVVEPGPKAGATPQFHFGTGRQVYPTGERAPGIVLESYQLAHNGQSPKAPTSLPGNLPK